MRVARVLPQLLICALLAPAAPGQTELDPELRKAIEESVKAKDWEAAEPLLSKAVGIAPDLAWAHEVHAQALHALGRLQGGLAAADRALALDPTNADAWEHRGSCLFDLQQLVDAGNSFRRAHSLDERKIYAYTMRQWTYALRGDHMISLALAGEAVRLWPDEINLRFSYEQAAQYAGRFDLALEQSRRAEAMGASALSEGKGRVETFLKAGRFDQARTLVDRLCEFNVEEGSEDARWLRAALLDQSALHAVSGSTQVARKAAERLKALHDAAWVHFYALLMFYADSKELPYDEALASLQTRVTETNMREDPDVSALLQILSADVKTDDLVNGPSNERTDSCQRLFLAAWRAERLGQKERCRQLLDWTVNTGKYRWAPYDMARQMPLERGVDLFTPALGLQTTPDPGDGSGLRITSITKGSAADLQGLEVGDRIVQVLDLPCTNARWAYATRHMVVGSEFALTFRRAGEDRRLKIVPGIAAN